jgi:hypothetical protein
MPANHEHYCPECDRSWRHSVCQVPWKPELACWKCDDTYTIEESERQLQRVYQWRFRDVHQTFSPVLGVSQAQRRNSRSYATRDLW